MLYKLINLNFYKRKTEWKTELTARIGNIHTVNDQIIFIPVSDL
jgi:hypothetical protein